MKEPKTLFDKIWESHVVHKEEGFPSVLYIDSHYVHEVTSPQAFNRLRKRKIMVRRPDKTWLTIDHNIPTNNQNLPIKDEVSRNQVETLERNANEFGLNIFSIGHPNNGIVHVIGPELGITKPGMTIVCGDSHTSTHGAFGAIAFGIGTSEVEEVLATQCILQYKPKLMRITVNGKLGKCVTAKDLALFLISKLKTDGCTGYFIEYSGPVVENLSMEERMTLCNMSIEMGARGALISPDEKTFEYIKGRKYAPIGKDFDDALSFWKTLKTDPKAKFDKEVSFDVSNIEPMITYGTNPGMVIKITESIPRIENFTEEAEKISFRKAIDYMGLKEGQKIEGQKIDYVFIGSCTNGRIEDFRAAASIIKGRKKSENVTVWAVPGSRMVLEEIKKEKLDKIFNEAGIEIREPGCSACLAMNEDKIPAGKYAVSTTNRNFEGRQGPGSRTFLASPLTAAAAAITGRITDPRKFI